MKWKVVVLEQFWRKVEAAADWYRREREDLRAKFIVAVDEAVERLAENPRLASRRLEEADVRWVRPAKFLTGSFTGFTLKTRS